MTNRREEACSVRSQASSGGTLFLTRKSTRGRLSTIKTTASVPMPRIPDHVVGLRISARKPGRYRPVAAHQPVTSRTAPICGTASYQGTKTRKLIVRKY